MHGSMTLQLFPVVGIFQAPGVSVVTTDAFSLRVKKILHGLVYHELTAYHSVSDLFLTQWIIAILSKGCNPDNFELHSSLKLSFMNTWGLCLNFVENESFLESNSSNIFALCEMNLDNSTDSGDFSARGYLSLIWKDSITRMHGLSVYVKEGLPFAWDLPLENWVTYVFNWLYFTQSLTSFSSINQLLCLYARFLMLFHLT